MNSRVNLILNADSYKPSQYLQYPLNTTGYFGYIMARAAEKSVEPIRETVFFGLQMFLCEYLSKPITMEDINEAESIIPIHGEPFNKKGWEYILTKYKGYIPVTINAAPEGMIIPEGNVLVTIECDDPECYWIAGYLETALLRAVWYPSTVATNSRECKKVLMNYLKLTSDDPEVGIVFKLHSFGSRGVSCMEAAILGGISHLVNFMGTDDMVCLRYIKEYYHTTEMCGFSIPASEHSTITSWGKDDEVYAFRNMIKQFGKKGAIFACVSDSYDIFNACRHLWGEKLKQEIIDSGATLMIRPDSGNPARTVVKCLKILDEKFGSTLNIKGYKILNNVKVIQGDGINIDSIREICRDVVHEGFSIDNVNFGMGGALLQHLNRDTLRFAMKCSATKKDGIWHEAFKSPIGDLSKSSLRGKVSLYRIRNGHGADSKIVTMRKEGLLVDLFTEEILKPVYVNGKVMNESTFDEVRKRASL